MRGEPNSEVTETMPSGSISFDLPLSVNVDCMPPVTVTLISNSQVLAIGEPVVYEVRLTNPKQFPILVDNFVPTNIPPGVASDVVVSFSLSSITIPAGETRVNIVTVTAQPTLSVQDVEFELNITADADAAP